MDETALSALAGRRPGDAAWSTWVEGLPELFRDALDEWALVPDGPSMHGETALVQPVRSAEGTPLVLKAAFPDPDAVGEIPTLKAWRGLGAVRLERADPRRGLLLLERLGHQHLSALDPLDAAGVVGGMYRRLHIPAPPTVPRLAPLVTGWLDDLQALGRTVPAPPRFVQQALAAGRRLVRDRHDELLHGDLHPGNVLAGRREPWLVIDPKGFAGDPCYEPAPLLWNQWDDLVARGDVSASIRERFYAVIDAAELDERHCRDWVVVRSMLNVSWIACDAARGIEPTDADRDLITRSITIAKAMQSVGDTDW